MKNNKKRKTPIIVLTLILLLAVVTAGLSFAYFTDRAEFGTQAVAGNIDLEYEPFFDLTGWDGKPIVAPGDILNVSYAVSNKGNISIDIRERFYIETSVPMNPDGQSEFEVYYWEDLIDIDGYIYTPIEGATTIGTKKMSAENKIITYEIPEYTLNGAESLHGENTQTEESVVMEIPGRLTPNPEGSGIERNATLLFNPFTGNHFQNQTVKVTHTIEAKQHRNTTGVSWETLATETFELGTPAVAKVN